MGILIVKIIRKNEPEAMSHSTLMRRMHRKIQDAKEFNEVIQTLMDEDRIDLVPSKRGVFYRVKKGVKGETL